MPDCIAVFASLLRQFSKSKALSQGRLLHATICNHGLHGNTLLGNLLIQLYGICGCVLDARAACESIKKPNLYTWNILIKVLGQNALMVDAKSVFDSMLARDVVSWNAIIAAFVQNEQPNEGLDLFHQMASHNVKPNDITFVCALDACASLASLEDGKQVYSAAVDGGYENDVIVCTAAVKMFYRCGCLDKAKNVFSNLPNKNVVSWNTMMAAYVEHGCYDEALSLLHQMQSEGMEPTPVTCVSALDACCNLDDIRQVHLIVIEYELEQDVYMAAAMLNSYGRVKALVDANIVFAQIQSKTIVMWNTIISAFNQAGHGFDALELFKQLCSQGIKPTNITFMYSLDACAEIKAHSYGQLLHTTLVSCGCVLDVMVSTALVKMYGICGSLHEARSIFDSTLERNTVCWTAMVGTYVLHELFEDALDLFRRMQLHGTKLDNIILGLVIDACAGTGIGEVGKGIHVTVVNIGHSHDCIMGNSLIKMYGKCGNIKDARLAFDWMPQRDTISWTTMMVAYTQNGLPAEALKVFQQMQIGNFNLDNLAFVCAFDACAQLAALKEGMEIETVMSQRRHGGDAIVGSALIQMYGKCGSMNDVERVFNSLPRKDVVTWTAVITAFAQNGYGKEVVALFKKMMCEGFTPNDITFLCVLNACSHTGLVEDAKSFFTAMRREYSLTYKMDHYMCMIDLLGRTGHLEDAQNLAMDVPQHQAASAWSSLLSSCRLHADLERAQHAAQRCFELDPKNDAPYVLLSNIYADFGQWDDVERVRKAMLQVVH